MQTEAAHLCFVLASTPLLPYDAEGSEFSLLGSTWHWEHDNSTLGGHGQARNIPEGKQAGRVLKSGSGLEWGSIGQLQLSEAYEWARGLAGS